jgi:hypothetical protein
MWEAKSNIVNNNAYKISLFEDKVQLCCADVIRHWRTSYEFRDFYISILKESSFDAFFWEHPPLTKSNASKAYEFVLVNSPQLSRVRADPNPFLVQFRSKTASQSIIAFENLGKDAELIVPCPMVVESKYAHFADFVRNAPKDQMHELFVVLANSLENKMGDKPTWVSTSGLGVYWLHIRLDTRPKYYSYQPYKEYVE